jgi:hypothetical protein
MQSLGWASDGIMAGIALAVYGLLLLLLVLARTAKRDPGVMRFVRLGLIWHLATYLFVVLWLMPYYAERDEVDAYIYHHDAIKYASMIRSGDWNSIPLGVGTEATSLATAILYAPLGGNVYGAVFFSAVLGFIAALFFCRALRPWCTREEMRKYCRIAIFLPSVAMWTSILGKDSWIALGLSLSAYGFSCALKQRASRPLIYLFTGAAILTILRPHIALSCAVAMAFAYCWGIARSMRVSILAKLTRATVLAASLTTVAATARNYLNINEFSGESIGSVGRSVTANNNVGGSAIGTGGAAAEGGMLTAVPRGILRVLLEPFPWEVHNLNSGLAAIENLLIAWFLFRYGFRVRLIWRAIVGQAYLLFCFALAVELLLMFSILPNLGLISRQRVQLLPFLFAVLVAAEATVRRARRAHVPAARQVQRDPVGAQASW